ncbi:hypothetical protein AcV5_008050 [Taiwanofungus camphoratus]|nr:hypothetical protein AcV5_008050 [Antrodia cinnamomea]
MPTSDRVYFRISSVCISCLPDMVQVIPIPLLFITISACRSSPSSLAALNIATPPSPYSVFFILAAMKFFVFQAVTLPALVCAHGIHGARHHARQDASSASASGNGVLIPDTTTPPTGTVSLTFSLASTNPTAVPLTYIASGVSTQPTIAISTTYAAGSKPTQIPNAPPLPNALSVEPSNYPALDVTPPTDSPEVQQWIQEVQNSGVYIPDIPVTQPGGCAANPEAMANTSNCWWTCGGCVRSTDITDCPAKNTWGLTYDDGPSPYTPDLLAYFDEHDLHSTFFVIGSRAISRPAMVQDEYMAGHQVAVHTWSHPYMTTKTTEEVIAELGWTKKVLKDVTGVTPLFWRPPYGDIDDRVRAISTAMNLIPVMWTRISATQTFDTTDWNIPAGLASSTEVLNNWDSIMGNSTKIDTGFIVLEHDLFQQTVDIAVGYILPEALAHQPAYNITPVVMCRDMPLSNSYMETNDNSTNPPPLAVYLVNSTSSTSASASAGAAQSTGGSHSSNSDPAAASSKNGAVGAATYSPSLVTALISLLAGVGIFLL